jgi:hypothetical protein
VRRAALLLVVVALLVAGCGGGGSSSKAEESKSADQIASDAQDAAKSAKSVHVHGKIVLRGVPLQLDLHLVRNVGAVGQMGLKGGTVRLVRVDSKVYMNGNEAFWAAYGGPAAARLYSNRWLTVPSGSSQVAPFVRLTDIDQLFGGTIGGHGKIEKGGTTTYNGNQVIALKEQASSGGTLYVAATGTPYPVAILSPNAGSEGSVAFDRWDKPVAISAPKGANPVAGR